MKKCDAIQAVAAALMFGEMGIGIFAAKDDTPALYPGGGNIVLVSEIARDLISEAWHITETFEPKPGYQGLTTHYDLTRLGGDDERETKAGTQ